MRPHGDDGRVRGAAPLSSVRNHRPCMQSLGAGTSRERMSPRPTERVGREGTIHASTLRNHQLPPSKSRSPRRFRPSGIGSAYRRSLARWRSTANPLTHNGPSRDPPSNHERRARSATTGRVVRRPRLALGDVMAHAPLDLALGRTRARHHARERAPADAPPVQAATR